MSYIKLFSREYTVQYADACIRMRGIDINSVRLPLDSLYIPEDGNEVFYTEETEHDKFVEMLKERYVTIHNQKKFIELFHTHGKKYVETAQRLGSQSFNDIGSLLSAYEEYFRIYILYTAYLWVAYIVNDIVAEQGRKILEKKMILGKEEAIQKSLFAPSQKSGILKLQAKLATFKKQGGVMLPRKEIASVLRDYAWMPCLDLQNKPWQEKDVTDFYEHLSIPPEEELQFSEAIAVAELSTEEQGFFGMVREFAYIKDERDVYRRRGVYAILSFYEQLGNKSGLSVEDVAYLTKNELMDTARNGVADAEKIRERKKGFLAYWSGSEPMVETSTEIIEEYKSKLKSESHTEIRGTVAFRGSVRGSVKIVRGVQDLVKIEPGDILVAVTTHPDYVPAMHKAGGFITDEGGITSHAAIVAREMKKPCIVGTRVATKILKDENRVKIDGSTGVVKILD